MFLNETIHKSGLCAFFRHFQKRLCYKLFKALRTATCYCIQTYSIILLL